MLIWLQKLSCLFLYFGEHIMILELLLHVIARGSVMTFLSDPAHVSHFSPQNKGSKRRFRFDAIEEPFLYPQSTEPFLSEYEKYFDLFPL